MARRKASPNTSTTQTEFGGGSSTNVVDLTNELWQAAVSLRGSIEPSDYKRYVLPLIFLRFLSLQYEKRRTELEGLINNPDSDYHEDTAVLDDPDEYRSAGAFIIPEEAKWVNILKMARADDVKVKLDGVLELLEDTYPEKLRGLLPRIYAGSNMDPENLRGLINLFSKEIFKADHGGEDVLGRVYEYFIGEFASSEGKRGGEYFTPSSIVKTLVAMLEPKEGTVFDPCCGSGGMFVQSDISTNHERTLSFIGQESKDFTYRLCRMNLFIHGIDGDIKVGNSYWNDQHPGIKADFIMANPPFNEGSKSDEGWGAHRIPADDTRLQLGNDRMPLAKKNANTMWILHFLSHLNDTGTAGFVMATGELSSSTTERLTVRQALIENDLVDCVVQLTAQLFAQTQIPCCLWFLSKTRNGGSGHRKRSGEVLFIDGRNLGTLIPGSRKQKQLNAEEIKQVAAVYHTFKFNATPEESVGFCKAASIDDIRRHKYVLIPGRYVGSEVSDDEEDQFEERMSYLTTQLQTQLSQSVELSKRITSYLGTLGYSVDATPGSK